MVGWQCAQPPLLSASLGIVGGGGLVGALSCPSSPYQRGWKEKKTTCPPPHPRERTSVMEPWFHCSEALVSWILTIRAASEAFGLVNLVQLRVTQIGASEFGGNRHK